MVGRNYKRHTYELNPLTERKLTYIKNSGLFRNESEAITEAISVLYLAIKNGEYTEEGHTEELE